MKILLAFLKKEYLETARTGKLVILVLLFVLFGVMNPAIAKLTPWIMEMFSDSLAESGLTVTNVRVDAFASWTQFFKNIPIALIAFVLIFSDSFTKEYKSGTLLLALTKGLSRYHVVLGKTAYFWDNSIVNHLFFAAAMWWLFSVWVIGLIVLFSSLLQNNTNVTLCIGGTVLLAYLLRIIPQGKAFSPAMLMNSNSILTGVEETDAYIKAILMTASMCVICVLASIPLLNKRQL